MLCSQTMRTRSSANDGLSEPGPSEKPPPTRTRAGTKLWLIGERTKELPTRQLPTKRQVLQNLYGNRKLNQRGSWVSESTSESPVSATAEKVLKLWARPAIPCRRKYYVINQIKSLDNEYKKYKKDQTKLSKLAELKRRKFVQKLDTLFDIARENAVDLIRRDTVRSHGAKKEDVLFLKDQRRHREMYMDAEDVQYVRKKREMLNKTNRKRTASKKEPTHSKRKKVEELTDAAMEVDSDTSQSSIASEDEYAPRKDQSASKTMHLDMPRKVLASSAVSTMADRLKMSYSATAGIASAILKAGGANLGDFAVSASTSNRSRKKERAAISKDVKKEFQSKKPVHVTLHWDGKLLENDSTGTKEERQAVLISGTPAYTEGKLLGIPVVDDGTGKSQAQTALSLLDDWDVRNDIRAMVFDTCAANTGRVRGACSRLERTLNRRLLWLGCRHHILVSTKRRNKYILE